MGATLDATRTYFQKTQVSAFKQKAFDGLTVSALGAGTYLGAADDATDIQYFKMLVEAGLGGVNFFDTAINYRGQRSERILGKALKELEIRGIPPESFVVGTKGGFLSSDSNESFEDYVRSHFLDTGIISTQEIVANIHCISPSFLEHQIDASRENLHIDCIDLYYLHNPEIQIPEIGEEKFYARLKDVFSLFEKKVSEKKIARYGIASWNGFRQKKGALQLSSILECAKFAGGVSHHFKAIQLPFNLVMLEALNVKNQIFGKDKWTIADIAREHNISLMASSPLMQAQVGRLYAKIFEALPQESSRMNQALQFVLSTPEICSAFVGMREMIHWEENRKSLYSAPWSKEEWLSACLSLGVASAK